MFCTCTNIFCWFVSYFAWLIHIKCCFGGVHDWSAWMLFSKHEKTNQKRFYVLDLALTCIPLMKSWCISWWWANERIFFLILLSFLSIFPFLSMFIFISSVDILGMCRDDCGLMIVASEVWARLTCIWKLKMWDGWIFCFCIFGKCESC